MAQELITKSYVLDTVPLSRHIEEHTLRPAIGYAVKVHVETVIGVKLANKLRALIDSGDIDLSENAHYKLLLESYVRPAAAYYVFYECHDAIMFKFEAKGILYQSSETSQNIDLDAFKYLSDRNKNKAQRLGETLSKFLRDNEEDYPEYADYVCGELGKPKKTAYSSGFKII